MKKIIVFLIIAFVVLAVLFVPIPTGTMNDGGSRVYSALTHKIVKWNRLVSETYTYKKTCVYLFPNNFKSIDELWEKENVKISDSGNSIANDSLILQTFDKSGLTFILYNETDKEYTYGEDYILSYFKDGTWLDVPYIIENGGFNSIGYSLEPYSTTEKITVDWTWLYGELTDGKYRFEK